MAFMAGLQACRQQWWTPHHMAQILRALDIPRCHAWFRPHDQIKSEVNSACSTAAPSLTCTAQYSQTSTSPGSQGGRSPPQQQQQPSSSPQQHANQLQLYRQQHAAVVADVAGVLQHVGLQPGLGCVVGDNLTTIDIGVLAGQPPTQIAVDVVPRPDDLDLAATTAVAAAGGSEGGSSAPNSSAPSSTSPSGGAPSAAGTRSQHTPQQRYAQAQVRRRLLASYGWVWVQVPVVEWVGIMQEDQARVQQGTKLRPGGPPGGPSAGVVGSIRHRYLELAVQEAAEQQQQQHGHHHHQHGGGCGPSCSH